MQVKSTLHYQDDFSSWAAYAYSLLQTNPHPISVLVSKAPHADSFIGKNHQDTS